MIAGKVSAHSVADMFQACNFTLNACRAYGKFSRRMLPWLVVAAWG